jgi:O-acetylserine/cysteine efflux transporter
MTASWLLLDEVPNAAELSGGATMLLGVLVALRPRRTAPLRSVPARVTD